jgi:hypothetical protein
MTHVCNYATRSDPALANFKLGSKPLVLLNRAAQAAAERGMAS